jgi:hypothetical protein
MVAEQQCGPRLEVTNRFEAVEGALVCSQIPPSNNTSLTLGYWPTVTPLLRLVSLTYPIFFPVTSKCTRTAPPRRLCTYLTCCPCLTVKALPSHSPPTHHCASRVTPGSQRPTEACTVLPVTLSAGGAWRSRAAWCPARLMTSSQRLPREAEVVRFLERGVLPPGA